MKEEDIKDLNHKLRKVHKEFEDFKLSLGNISYFQQKESDNLKIIEILKKDIDYKDNLLKLTKDKYETMINEYINEKQSLLNEINSLRQE